MQATGERDVDDDDDDDDSINDMLGLATPSRRWIFCLRFATAPSVIACMPCAGRTVGG